MSYSASFVSIEIDEENVNKIISFDSFVTFESLLKLRRRTL